MKTLVIAEQNQGKLKSATLNVITAANKFDLPIDVLVTGEGAAVAAKTLQPLDNIEKIRVNESEAYAHGLAEPLCALVCEIATPYVNILVGATTFGKNVLPRIAACLDVGQISDVIAIKSATEFDRPIYAGNVIETIESLDPIRLLSIRTTAFPPAEQTDHEATIETLTSQTPFDKTQFIKKIEQKLERPELTTARIVVAGGRGLGSKENFKLIEQLADKLNAAIGASRAAVDAGFVPNDMQIGQTGKVVAPELYIAVGISGAIQHISGMKESKVIVAINQDPDAPIFKVADYGIVGDLFVILPELINSL